MDLQEFESRILPSKQKLYRLAFFLLQNKEEAEDLLQDVLLKLWKNKNKLHVYANIEAFAMTVTRNLCLNQLKVRKRRIEIDVMDMELRSEEPTPYQQFENADNLSKIQELVDALPELQKLVLHLRQVEGCSFEEMEQITNLTVNHLRVVLSRARKNVQDGFLKMENYEVR